MEQIIKAAERATDLTRQLLAFSRKQVFQLEVVNLNEIVKNMEKMLRRLIEEHIELELSLAEDLPYVKVDPAQIEQVIMNLAVNARDAMPTGGKLTIETREATLNENDVKDRQGVMPGKYVMLAVTDTGCGMDKEVLPYIFEPFFTTKEKGKGTGLGLSTVYGIVKQSEGDIRVHSKPGKGSRFEVYIPVTNEQPKEIMEGVGQGESLGKGEKILVVEDKAELRELMEQILSSLGYKVILASNGEEALSKVSELRLKPDLLITDVIMPVMNGRQLVERLKRKYPDLKVIYISGYTDDITAQMGVLESEAPFIQKPFNTKDFAEKVWKVLHEKGNGKLQ
ncbi:MAG: response regulator [Deltaproteobacteria bacterium]|nr:response regulator [Deltaproteobacteria bacterium]